MKTLIQFHARRSNRAFTFTEILVVTTLLMMVLAGVIGAHLFGIRMFEITKAKLGANDEARQAISLLMEEIRTAKQVKIGSGTMGSFTVVAVNSAQNGSAIQIYPTLLTNNFIRYFWDSTSKQLMRTTNGASAMSVVAHSITNQMIFTSEDFRGNTLTNNENNRVIGLTLKFYQIQYPIVLVGPGHYYDYYQLRTRITRRTINNA